MRLDDKKILVFGPLMYVSNRRGNADERLSEPKGLTWYDTRMVRTFDLRINGEIPNLLTTEEPQPNLRRFGLTLTDRTSAGLFQHPRHFVHITRTQFLDAAFVDALEIRNFTPRPVPIHIRYQWSADFADVSEIRQPGLHDGGGRRVVVERLGSGVRLAYRGHDARTYFCDILMSHPAASVRADGGRVRVALASRGIMRLSIEIRAGAEAGRRLTGRRKEEPRTDGASIPLRLRALERQRDKWFDGTATIESDNPALDRELERALDDVRCLDLPLDGLSVPSAGVPLFHAPFGRDMILTAFSLLPFRPQMAREVLLFLAERQGRVTDVVREEEPGKILHELRLGELAGAGKVPHNPYYGSIDVSLLFVSLLHEYFLWTGDEGTVRNLAPALARALEWAEVHGDADGDGWIEYDRLPGRGLVHKGWKDSRDSLTDERGRSPRPPIRLVEVQGYWVDALRRSSELFGALGDTLRASRCAVRGRELQRRIESQFSLPRTRYTALALDGAYRQLRLITSNPGHLLFSGAVGRRVALSIRDRLFKPDMHSGWGIRTLSSDEAAYHPLHYHRGTVWPHDNAIIAFGLSRYGMTSDAASLFTSLREAVSSLPGRRWPELFCGFGRTDHPLPVPYPLACAPQAWSAASLFLMLRASMGLFADAPAGHLELRKPILPPGLTRLSIRGLRIGRSVGTLSVSRARCEWIRRSGPKIRLRRL
ncbi:MAG: amylo-alpha-1,6-glucosidase [Nitrospirae bacterium]|nr:amylo-alpha-1,6-glucosidase [Nitrospirota bacterium]